MSTPRGFRYGLAPVLLTRTWELNALLEELGDCNAELARQQQQHQILAGRTREAEAAWSASVAADAALSVQEFERVTRFLSDLRAQSGVVEAALVQAQQARDVMIEKVVLAQRALEAFEQHRDDMKAQFARMRMSGDFKIADDQWNTLQARIDHYET